MRRDRTLPFEKIGFSKSIPEEEDKSNYETLLIKDSLGNTTKLYRSIIDNDQYNITNFNASWKVYNKLI
tara:strand:- start:18 stop:224 length:207 start_codon:yes stop_codon:yes gene_type:complete